VQLDPAKPTLKPPGTERLNQRLNLTYDELFSSFAFNFNLRRCNKATGALEGERDRLESELGAAKVGRCRLTLSNPR